MAEVALGLEGGGGALGEPSDLNIAAVVGSVMPAASAVVNTVAVVLLPALLPAVLAAQQLEPTELLKKLGTTGDWATYATCDRSWAGSIWRRRSLRHIAQIVS